MKQLLSLAVMLSTAYLLIATSQAPCSATPETLVLQAATTCGPSAPVIVAVDARCVVTVTGAADAGLPAAKGNVGASRSSPLINQYIFLYDTQLGADGGITEGGTCDLRPNDAGTGYDVACASAVSGPCEDGGVCAATCDGTLTL